MQGVCIFNIVILLSPLFHHSILDILPTPQLLLLLSHYECL